MKEYVYRVRDYSVLMPGFKKVFLIPLSAWVPRSVPPNIITIFSNSCIYATLLVSASLEPWPLLRFACLALLIFIYLTGDHMDGLQAKRTGTSSPLGEFIDHYMDAYNNVIYLLVMYSAFGITNPYLISFTLFASYTAHASIFYEQFRTGWLVFEKIGPFEAFTLSVILFLLCCFPGFRLFIQSPLLWRLNGGEVMLLALTFGTFTTLAKAQSRTGKGSSGLYLFYLLLAAVIISGLYLPFSPVFMPWIIALYSIHYVGMLIKSHLTDDQYRMPDLITPAFILFCIFFPSIAPARPDFIIFIYLAGRCLISAAHTFYQLRIYWAWVNPAQ